MTRMFMFVIASERPLLMNCSYVRVLQHAPKEDKYRKMFLQKSFQGRGG